MSTYFVAFCIFATLFNALADGRRHPKSTEVTVEQVTVPVQHAEGPHWDHVTEKLFFVDIHQQKIRRLDPGTGDVTYVYIENGPVGVAIPVEDSPNQLVVGAGLDLVLVDWDVEKNSTDPTIRTLATVDSDRASGTRFNDGKVDSRGRLWAGTMGPEVNLVVTADQGSLYRITDDLIPSKVVSPVNVSNGEAWNLQDDKMYYIDTPTKKIAQYDFDPDMGTISNRKIVFDLEANNVTGLPDGMTIDTDGNLWIAVYTGSRVINVNPRDGSLIRSIELPAELVSSVAFGGPLLDTLYVTTSRYGLNETELEAQPKAGSVFAVKGLGVHGFHSNSFALQ